MRYLVIILLLGSLAQCIVAASEDFLFEPSPTEDIVTILPTVVPEVMPEVMPEVVVPYTFVTPDLPAPPKLNMSLNLSNQSLLNLSNSAVISSLEKACPCSPT